MKNKKEVTKYYLFVGENGRILGGTVDREYAEKSGFSVVQVSEKKYLDVCNGK